MENNVLKSYLEDTLLINVNEFFAVRISTPLKDSLGHEILNEAINEMGKIALKSRSSENFFSNGKKVMNGEYAWFKVEPIIWIIRNWEDLPTVINPRGNGTAKYIDLKSEEGIMTSHNNLNCTSFVNNY